MTEREQLIQLINDLIEEVGKAASIMQKWTEFMKKVLSSSTRLRESLEEENILTESDLMKELSSIKVPDLSRFNLEAIPGAIDESLMTVTMFNQD